MNIKKKHILILAVILFFAAIFFWRKNPLKIEHVDDGGTLTLNNGAKVALIGVQNTQESVERLRQCVGQEVEIIPDASNMFDPTHLGTGNTVYAYVNLLNDSGYREALNRTLLVQGLATLEEATHLHDSLDVFRQYAKSGAAIAKREENDNGQATPTPTPARTDPINYEADSIRLGPYNPPSERKHSAWYDDGTQNTNMLDEACDFNLPYTKNFANQLAARSPGDYKSKGIDQVCQIVDYCYSKWRYVSDPAEQEYVARASETIAASLTGDCDDYAVLIASCVIAIGGNARIVVAHKNEGGQTKGHAYAELDITGLDHNHIIDVVKQHFSEYNVTELHYTNAGTKQWLNLDWSAAYPGGKYWEADTHSFYVFQNGHWQWEGRQ